MEKRNSWLPATGTATAGRASRPGPRTALSLILGIVTLSTMALPAIGSSTLTAPEAEALAEEYLGEHRLELGLESEDVAGLMVTDAYVSSHTGTRHVYLRQLWQGIEVFGGNFTLNLTPGGEVLHVGDRLVRELRARIEAPLFGIAVTPTEAVARAAQHLGLPSPIDLEILEEEGGPARRTSLSDGWLSDRPIPVRLVWARAGDRSPLRLAWNLEIERGAEARSWSVRIDAETGELIDAIDLVSWDSYRVYPLPVASPDLSSPPAPSDGRTLVTDPAASGSPFGWHDTDGVAGAETTGSQGNNAKAYTDRDGDGAPGVIAGCGAAIECDFALDLTLEPSDYQEAAVTNAFYWVNSLHDVLYGYGFDTTAGNFQHHNYGGAGAAGDRVNVVVQFAADLPAQSDPPNRCNAFWTPTADGTEPSLTLAICDQTSPRRDAALVGQTIAHEYGHGLSTRLIGGPSNITCQANAERPSEGWSDFLGLLLTTPAGAAGTDPLTVGTYVRGQEPSGAGIRLAPYSTDLAINGYTYSSLAGLSEEHDVGFVWATALWDATWKLIEAHPEGLNVDIAGSWSTGGNNLALQLAVDSLKMQPCGSGFVDAREAILAAEDTLTDGTYHCPIWYGFAKRGLGLGALQGSADVLGDESEAFDMQLGCGGLSAAETTAKICTGADADPAVYSITLEDDLLAPDIALGFTDPGLAFQMAADPQPVTSLPQQATVSFTHDGTPAAGLYDVSLVAADSQSVEALLELTLELVDTAPPVPAPHQPADSATEVPLQPVLAWTGGSPEETYSLEVDDDPTFASPEIAADGLAERSHVPELALEPATTFYWRVQARDGCRSAFSPALSFTTAPAGKLVPPDELAGGAFGQAVAVSGYLALVGVPEFGSEAAPNMGAAYLYHRNAGGAEAWGLVAEFYGSATGERFGGAVAIDGETLAIGVPGADGGAGVVEVYERNAGGADAWGLVEVLQLPGAPRFGNALDLDGDHLVAGAPGSILDDGGQAAVFRRTSSGWSLAAALTPGIPPAVGDHYGAAVAISGDHIAVGAPFDDFLGEDSGRVRIFSRNVGGADAWGWIADSLPPPDGTSAENYYGIALAMDAGVLLVGNPGDVPRGAVLVLERNHGGADAWGQVQELRAADDDQWLDDPLGVAVALHGDLAVVGRAEGFGTGGAAYLFEYTAAGPAPWVEVASSGPPDWPSCGYGEAVAVDHGTLLIASRCDDPGGVEGAGSAYLVERQLTGWEETTKVLGPTSGYGLGSASAISGGIAVVAADIGDELPIVYRRDMSGEWASVAALEPLWNPDNEDLCGFGYSLAIDADHAVVSDPCFRHANDGSDGAVFVFRRNFSGPDAWGQVARLVPANQAVYRSSRFGDSVAIDGDLIAVGDRDYERDPDDAIREGAAFLFRRNKSGMDAWGQLGGEVPLRLDGGLYADDDDAFGATVAISGHHLLVAATRDEVKIGNVWETPGVGYLFEIVGDGAVLRSRLVGPDVETLDLLGWVSGLDGPDVFLTAANGDGIYLFERNTDGADAWGFSRKRCGSDGTSCHSGAAIDGGLILAGGTTDRINVFLRNEGEADAWGHAVPLSLIPSDAPANNNFGFEQFANGLDRGNAVIGAWGDDDNGINAGAAYVFRLQGTWPTTPPIPPCSVGLSDLVLSDETILDTRLYEACKTITAERFTVGSGADVTFRAGSKIVLGDGFQVGSSASFVAEIDPTIQ